MATPQVVVAQSAPTLTFPREIFAALQPRQYLSAHLAPPSKSTTPIRPNGRKPLEFREPVVNTDSLSHCNGSAVVRVGDTSVVCGVRGEMLLASDVPNPPSQLNADAELEEDEDDADEIAELGLIVPNIELATGSTSKNIPGSAPSNLAQSLTSRLLRTLSSTRLIRARDLRIKYRSTVGEQEDVEPGTQVKGYWTLYLDVLFLSLDGSGFDAAWLAVLAALKSTQLPRAWWDPDMEMILCSDAVAEATKLNLRGFPVSTSFAVFDETTEEAAQRGEGHHHVLADPDNFEESVCLEVVSVVVDCSAGSKRAIRALEKRGGTALDPPRIRLLLDHAIEWWKSCSSTLA